MARKLATVTVKVTLHDIPVRDDDPEQVPYDLLKLIDDRLVLLDIKGGRTGDDGRVGAVHLEKNSIELEDR